MSNRTLLHVVAIVSVALVVAPWTEAEPIISVGTPTTTVPSYLCDGSYWFPTSLCPLAPDEVLLPIEISGAVNLQNWQFDLLFDNTAVQEVDPLDGSSGIYGAEFTSGDLNSLSFILSGFPFNFLGEVDTVAGSYPSLLTGPSGNGPLAFILFQCVQDPATCNGNFSIQGTTVVQGAPEPATFVLLASGLALLGGRRLLRRQQRN